MCVLTVLVFLASRRRHTRCALVTGVQTCALPIWRAECFYPNLAGPAKALLARTPDRPCRDDLLARRVFQLYGVDTRTDDADRPLLRPGGLDAADRRILCDGFDPARNAQTESPRTVEFIGGDPRHGFERPPVAAPVAIRLAIEELGDGERRSEEHTSELQSLMRNSYAVFCLTKK